MNRLLACALLLIACQAPAAEPVRVMVLGTFHFDNPGLDIANVQVDDVLQPRRQAELRALADSLARFQPTLVAVEQDADALPDRALPAYSRYLAGEGREDRNEILQIGYRLAQRAGLRRVVGIDTPGAFPFEAVQAWAGRHGRSADLDAEIAAIQARVNAMEAQQRTQTIGRVLHDMNRPEVIREDNGFYLRLLGYGAGAEQPGAALLGAWTARNLAICARLVQVARAGDRVVVVYGAGHSAALRQCVTDLPGWQLVEAVDYLPR
ncbi:hypothetical protein KAK07_19870 [Ideonella sp. 4Y16]|uniref:DUF5694 domain-containing protein n=1 Tax=Ideonella alba TaxID=2824118 RepID=UPI001B360AB3|nr:DUF5694 domain-containing protein [Ideonella alba]MBQ0945607.1 hypothetical protein [Ideonella alba]